VKNSIYIVAATLVLTSVFAGCKGKANDPLTVVNKYFAAMEKGDIDEAYPYLCDRSLVIKAANGEELRFKAKPDLDDYKVLMEYAPRITVTKIIRMDELSREGELEIFQVTARTKERDRNVERSSAQFMIYLAPNSEGRWSVLIPVSAKVAPRGAATDTSVLQAQ